MSEEKKAEMDDAFHDLNGNPVSLFELVRSEPEWAASRIREGIVTQAENERLWKLLKACQPYIEAYDPQWVCELGDEIEKEVGDD